ncbi:MAG: allophanate hydrolase [Gramella sp.]|nr:allophanate hydrolase [Christiangramia sp.]
MEGFPKISRMGERSILIQFDSEISENTLRKVLFYKNRLERKLSEEKLQIINTYNSILISYERTIEDAYSAFLTINEVLSEANILKKDSGKVYRLPVCYSEEFGPDLHVISKRNNLAVQEIIRLHSAQNYLVYFIGFLPGFLYLGGLDQKLHIPRKESPRQTVEKGSVGIAGSQTGIYPKSSPGGWQLIGRSPVDLFNPKQVPPCEISPGDQVVFEPVSEMEYFQIERAVQKGAYSLKFDRK